LARRSRRCATPTRSACPIRTRPTEVARGQHQARRLSRADRQIPRFSRIAGNVIREQHEVCGIIGYYGPTARLRELAGALELGLQSLSHRGPDDHGTWEDARDGEALGLGHRRLSILDL